MSLLTLNSPKQHSIPYPGYHAQNPMRFGSWEDRFESFMPFLLECAAVHIFQKEVIWALNLHYKFCLNKRKGPSGIQKCVSQFSISNNSLSVSWKNACKTLFSQCPNNHFCNLKTLADGFSCFFLNVWLCCQSKIYCSIHWFYCN